MLWILEGCYLVICARSDIRSGLISVKWSCFMMLIAVLFRILCYQEALVGLSGDCVPGLLCMLLSVISHQSFGMGDAWIMLVSGLLLGSVKIMRLMCLSFLLGGIYGCVLFFGKKKKKEDPFPFAPCILGAYVIISFGQII